MMHAVCRGCCNVRCRSSRDDIESVATTLRSGSKAGVQADRRYFRPADRNAWNAAWASGDLSAALKACISAAI
jgi:hypothetical protein